MKNIQVLTNAVATRRRRRVARPKVAIVMAKKPVNALKRKRAKQTKFRTAPVAMGLSGRKFTPSGVFLPTQLYTNDLLDTVLFGTVSQAVIFNTRLAPQELPPNSRGKLMARMFAKYRPKSVLIRIESAVPTSSGGQYAAFFDPNPSNNWLSGNAVGALTSMPVQDVGAAWECLRLSIPPQELERDTELYTQDATSENLITRFGQLVILNIATPNTTPPGTAELSVWMEVEWEFYEPNATAVTNTATVAYAAGPWNVLAAGDVQPNGGVGGLIANQAYRLFPELPGSLFVDGLPIEYVSTFNNNTPFAARTEQDAINHATTGAIIIIPGKNVPVALPAEVAVPIQPPAAALPKYPYNRVVELNRSIAEATRALEKTTLISS